MKKLIIAAAVAVVSIGAFAADGYDFTATLKTTKGKTGKSTYEVKLGADAIVTSANIDTVKFWYEDPSMASYIKVVTKDPLKIEILDTENFTTKTLKGTTVPTLTAKGLKNDSLLDTLESLQTTFKYPSAGVYCLTFKRTDEGCYRVAGTVKIDVDLFTSNCCAVTFGSVAITNYFDGVEGGIYINQASGQPAANTAAPLIQRFGSLDYAKATKVEMFAMVEKLPTTDDRTFIGGMLAGQGTYSTKDDLVNTVSGNIVGVVTPPLCPNCCAVPQRAVAFICDLPVADPTLNTAAFGTFRLKYNKKISD